MPSVADLLEARIERFTVRTLKFVRSLPTGAVGETLARQLARSVCGFADNRRSARRARSRAEFVSRLAVSVDEVDETCKWLERVRDSNTAAGEELHSLLLEGGELRATAVASLATARRKNKMRQEEKDKRRKTSSSRKRSTP